MNKFWKKLDEAKSLPEIFELVKDSVRIVFKKERTGLMLGLSDLGSNYEGFIGAFYPVGSNIIIMNKRPLRSIETTDPSLFNNYVFHILLHEYFHTLGIIDEELARYMTLEVSKKVFGENHVVTEMAKNFAKFFPNIVYPTLGWESPESFKIELVDNFDHSNVGYIG